MDIDASWASDHYGVSMKVATIEKSKRGPGRIRIDPNLFLEDNVRKEILRKYNHIYTKFPIAKWGSTVVFEKFKDKMTETLKAVHKTRKRAMRKDIKRAEDQLNINEKMARGKPPSQEIVNARKKFELELKKP